MLQLLEGGHTQEWTDCQGASHHGNTAGGGLGSASYSQGAGAQSKTQKTLTVIIKYDENKSVRDFAYHSSKF